VKYILEFETLEELLIAQAKINGTRVTDSRAYNEEIKAFHNYIFSDEYVQNEKKEFTFSFKLRMLIANILKQEADIRKSMFL
jgi:hypothetical protein